MSFIYLKFEQDQAVGIITLNRPEKRNALSLPLLKELDRLLDQLHENNEIKAVIVRGAGKVFSSGHDLIEVSSAENGESRETFETCSRVMLKIRDMPQPFIAQVHGIAAAAGCQLVAACDLALAEEGALFTTPGVKIGFFCTTPAIPLVRAVGRKRALEMLFTARMITAAEAERYGLVNRVVPLDVLELETRILASQIAQASLSTLSIGKRAFYSQVDMTEPDAYAYGSAVMVDNLLTYDAKEGISAFLAKRTPVWQNR
jgi:enoyl-CoA hydratase/carnithine racemase